MNTHDDETEIRTFIDASMPPAPELPLPLPDIEIPVPNRARTMLTQAKVERYLEAIALGATPGLAANYAGVSPTVMRGWVERIPELAEAVDACQAIAAMKWLSHIEKAAEAGQWQAAAWKLERLYPDLYGRRDLRSQSQDVKGPTVINSPVVITQAKTTLEQWRQTRQNTDPPSTSPPLTKPDSS